MNDKELYKRILGINGSWEVTDVQLDIIKKEVLIQVEYKSEQPVNCPECQREAAKYDHKKRRWRHLDTCQMKTIIECEIPRTNCREHGIKQIAVPWAESNSRFTALFEALVITWMKEASIKAVGKAFGISWDQAAKIQEHAVERGMRRRAEGAVKEIGIDETSYQKRHEYVTILLDREKDRVVEVLDDRKAESLDKWLQGRTKEEKEGYTSITMDMWNPYIKAVKDNVPGAEKKICFDHFHVSQHLNKGIDKVRAEEHRDLLKETGESPLTGTRYGWLKNAAAIDNRSRMDFMKLTRSKLRTARAWAIKETANRLWGYQYWGCAKKAWGYLCAWMSRSRLKPMIKLSRMIKRYLWGIVNAITLKANNSMLEAKNGCIQKIKDMACGFGNRDRFKRAIMFHLGGLDMLPSAAKAANFPT